jgi:hypothetical protein
MSLGAFVLPDLMTRPEWSFKDDAQHAPISHAFNPGMEPPLSLFDAYLQPGYELRRVRFNAAMAGQPQLHSPRTLLDGMQLLVRVDVVA